jgi:hypothetical protein
LDKTVAVALDYQVARHIAIRGELGYDTRSNIIYGPGYDYHGGGMGAVAVRAFRDTAYHGAFIDAELKIRTFSTSDVCNSNGPSDPFGSVCHNDWIAWSPRLRVGWQITLNAGLTMEAAVGVGYESVSRDEGDVGDTNALFVSSLRVGYAF